MSFNLVSTRDESGNEVALKYAILQSQPKDGGLYTFPELPYFDKHQLDVLLGLGYKGMARTILGKFDFGLSEEELADIIDEAYGDQWDSPEITPLSEMSGNNYLLHLDRGPTQAFKDVALQFLPRILRAYEREKLMIALGASSGDTISAAFFGVGNMPNMGSVFLLPQEGPSEVQRLQSISHGFKNAIAILIDGNFDDAHAIIVRILSEPEYADMKEENNFISFNSINIARIMAQIVYYFSAYGQLQNRGDLSDGEEVNFSVPSGNFGDALAGVFAKKMGLPIARINVATNENDILDRFLRYGVYEPRGRAIITSAPSQDITKASNFERMIYLVLEDPTRVSGLMKDLKENGRFEVTSEELKKFREILTSSSTNDRAVTKTIRHIFAKSGEIIDPHTATGVDGGMRVFGGSPENPTVFLATASHVKFPAPPGVPRDEDLYNRVVGSLSKNDPFCLESSANPDEVIAKVLEAVGMIKERI